MTDNTTEQNDFLGRGWSFPPAFDRASGAVLMREKEADIAESLEILLTTTPGERIMEPRYGCNMADLVFESLNTTTMTIIKDRIRTAILYFEARIDTQQINLNREREAEGVILIEIDYVVRATNSRFNFVYPYYLNEGTELQLPVTNNPLPR